MKNVVIEIEGDRHRLFTKDKVACGCVVCSLSELCDYRNKVRGLCEPYLAYNEYGHFEEEK